MINNLVTVGAIDSFNCNFKRFGKDIGFSKNKARIITEIFIIQPDEVFYANMQEILWEIKRPIDCSEILDKLNESHRKKLEISLARMRQLS